MHNHSKQNVRIATNRGKRKKRVRRDRPTFDQRYYDTIDLRILSDGLT